jgi:hypothetical protein
VTALEITFISKAVVGRRLHQVSGAPLRPSSMGDAFRG